MEKQYTDWIIIDDIPILKKGKKYFKCRCICGIEKYVQLSAMKNNKSKRCSSCAGKLIILPKEFTDTWIGKKHGELNRTLYIHIKNKADERNLSFELSQKILWDLLVKQDFKCKVSNMPIHISTKIKNGNPDFKFITASVDRIDSSKGYTIDNIQWVNKDINKMKMNFDNEYFINACKLIANNN